MHRYPEKRLLMLRPEEIVPSSHQLRRCFSGVSLKKLTESIAANGVINPPIVRKCKNGKYELISGEMRLRAAAAAGVRRIPCVVYRVGGQAADLFSLNEALHQNALSPFELAEGLWRVMKRSGLGVSELSENLGISEKELELRLRMLRIADEQRAVILENGLTIRHIAALLRLPDEKRQTALDKMVNDNLTAPQAEEYVSSLLETRGRTDAEPVRKLAIGDVRIFSNSLNKMVDMLIGAGIDARSKKYETEKYVEFRVRIPKEENAPKECRQLKIC